jgi:ABC-type nitrate/sulfonate/bicarbonate transport system permease component
MPANAVYQRGAPGEITGTVSLLKRTDWVGKVLRTFRKSVVPVAILVAWAVISSLQLIKPLYLPGPLDLWESLINSARHLPKAIVSSVSMTLLGFASGTTLGIATGLVMAYSKGTRQLFGGVLDFLRPVPPLALIPLFVLWFGIGKGPQIALIIFGTSVILGLTTMDAIRNVPAVHIRAALTLGASRAMIYRTVILPSIMPHILGAVRVAGVASWGLDVAAEFIGAQTGLGYLIIVRKQYLDTPGILLIVIIFSLLALGLDYAIRIFERPITKWTERSTRRGIVASLVGAG